MLCAKLLGWRRHCCPGWTNPFTLALWKPVLWLSSQLPLPNCHLKILDPSALDKSLNIFHESPFFLDSFHFSALLFFTDKLITGLFIHYFTSHLFLNLSSVSSTSIIYQCPVTSIVKSNREIWTPIILQLSTLFGTDNFSDSWNILFLWFSTVTCSADLPIFLVIF